MNDEQLLHGLQRFVADGHYSQAADSDDMKKGLRPLKMMGFAGRLLAHAAGVRFPARHQFFSNASAEAFEEALAPVRELTPLVFCRFPSGGVDILAVLPADEMADDEIIGAANTIEQSLMALRQFAAKKYTFFVPQTVAPTRCDFMLVFFNPGQESRQRKLQERCYRSHALKHVYLTPWVLNVPRKSVAIRSAAFDISRGIFERRAAKLIFGR